MIKILIALEFKQWNSRKRTEWTCFGALVFFIFYYFLFKLYNAGNFEQWAPGHPESIAKQLLFSAIFDWLTTVHLYHILVLVGNLTSSDTTLDSRRWVWLLVYIIFKVIKRNTAKHSRCSARLNGNQDPFDKRFPTPPPPRPLIVFYSHGAFNFILQYN